MNNTDLLKSINSIVDKIGISAGNFHQILLRQAKIDAIENSFSLIIIGVIFSVLLCRILDEKNKNPEDEWMDIFGENPFLSIMFALFSLTFFACIFLCGSSIIDSIFNPEYHSIHAIFKAD